MPCFPPRPGLLRTLLSFALAGLAAARPSARAQESVYQGVFVTSNLDATLSPIAGFEAAAGKGASIVNIFQAIDSTGNFFPDEAARAIRDHGSIPLITLEPWLGLDDIASGKHDDLLSVWALGAKAWGHPFFFRYAHEMNTTWYPWAVWASDKNNTAAKYVAAWRHVHELFTSLGVTNVTWVWCVNRFYDDRSARIADLYPGDRYVDWTSFDAYNRGTVDGNSWREFRDASLETYDEILRIAPGKPVMVAETGTVEQGGDKAAWFRNALKNHLKTRFPRIKAWVYFNLDKSGFDNRVQSTETARAAYAESVGLSYFSNNHYASLSASPIPPLLNDAQTADTEAPFVRFALPTTGTVTPGRLRTEIRVEAGDKNAIDRVEIFVDDVRLATERVHPYQYFWDVPSVPGRSYAIKAVAYDTAGNAASASHVVTALYPPSVYWGVFTTSSLVSNFQSILDFEAQAGKPVSIINLFQSWSGAPAFPSSGATNIRDHGSIPLVTWEPWNTANGVNQPTYRLRAIADGAHDAYITAWATAAKNWGQPFFLRFAHEMNGDWYPWCVGVNGNTAQDYIDAWRRVHGIFRSVGATNATWVWCVNRILSGTTSDFNAAYPGDRYVDWTSLDCYNRGTAQPGFTWRTFNVNYAATYAGLVSLAPGKPVMAAESGCVEEGGDKAAWFATGLKNELLFNFPRIKAYVWFNLDKNGFDNRIASTEASRAAFADGIALDYYPANTYKSLSASPIPPLLEDALPADTQPPFVGFVRPLAATVPAGLAVELRAEASDKSGVSRVEFYAGSTLLRSDDTAPFLCTWTAPATVGAAQQIRAVAYDTVGNFASASDTLVTVAPVGAPAIYWGAIVTDTPAASLQPVLDFEAASGKGASILNLTQAWLGGPAFPAASFDAIRAHGSIPLLTWEPRDPAGGVNQSAFTLASIANGAHDAYLSSWAAAARTWGRPFFLRLAPQPNGDWFPWAAVVNGNTAADYVSAWRRVHGIFESAGATNATWVWSVNRSYGGASANIAALYPGDHYVDWLGMDGYNRGGSVWRSFSATFGDTYAALLAIASGKPVIVTETGAVEDGGDKAAWLRDVLQTRLLATYPRIKALLYCEIPRDGYANSISTSDASRAAFAEAIASPCYTANTFASLATSPVPPLVGDPLATDTQAPFITLSRPLAARVVAGQTAEIRVEFADRSALDRIEIFVDGVRGATERLAPYQYFWPVPSAVGASYALSATAYDSAGNSSTATYLVTGVAPPHPVDVWREARFTSAQLADTGVSGDSADPDRDGLPNLLEYALDLAPLSPDVSVIQAQTSGSRLSLAFRRIASTGIRYEVQASSDLSAWTGVWTSSGAQNIAGPVTVTDSADLAQTPRRFLRLRIARE